MVKVDVGEQGPFVLDRSSIATCRPGRERTDM